MSANFVTRLPDGTELKIPIDFVLYSDKGCAKAEKIKVGLEIIGKTYIEAHKYPDEFQGKVPILVEPLTMNTGNKFNYPEAMAWILNEYLRENGLDVISIMLAEEVNNDGP